MAKQESPKLKFGPTATMTGFTGYSTASFNNLPPARIVRELIQNSLDAATEAGEKTAVIRFRVSHIEGSDVPDLNGYERAFKSAVASHKKIGKGLSDAAQQVVGNITRALKLLKEEGHYSLSVLDNGIGLDEVRMTSFLGDGAGVKDTELSGSYGVGHFASIPASDLRYVLYGGVLEDGTRVASGTAILASRPGRRNPRAAQGYLVRRFLGGTNGSLYRFIERSTIPDIIDSDLDEIEHEWEHGTTIVIPAFNYFGRHNRRNLSLWDIVSKVAAYNFSVAIHQGHLVVEVDEALLDDDVDADCTQRLNKDTLGEVLELERQGVRRARRGSLFEGLRPSGQSAHAAYQTQTEGTLHAVHTAHGDISLRLLTPSPTGSVRVDLFRNGMWITDDIVGLRRSDFTNRQPFHAVLTLNSSEGKELHRLVRKAEGPMHDELARNRLTPQERKRLDEAIEHVSDKIKEEIPEVGTDTYSPDDYLYVETGGDGQSSGRTQFSMWGTPVAVQRPRANQRVVVTDTGGGGPDDSANGRRGNRRRGGQGGGSSGVQTRRRNSRPLPLRSTSVPDGDGKHLIALESIQSFDEVLLSLRVDENTDATCDRVWPDEDVLLRSVNISARGAVAPNCQLEPGGRSIRISGLSAGETYQLELEYESPPELVAAVGTPVFRVDLQRP